MTITLPELEITVANSNFDSAQLGSARWFTYTQNGAIDKICLWQGINIYTEAHRVLSAFNTRLSIQSGLNDVWRTTMEAQITNIDSTFVDTPVGYPELLATLRKPVAQWNITDQRICTKYMVFVALYQYPTSLQYARGIRYPQIELPPDTIPIPIGRIPTPIENPNLNVPREPVCYPANTRLAPVTDDTTRPMPTPSQSPLDVPPIQLTSLPMEPAMDGGGDMGFAIAAVPLLALMRRKRGKK